MRARKSSITIKGLNSFEGFIYRGEDAIGWVCWEEGDGMMRGTEVFI